ncbi:MAG: branched-chain amino acid aminotransferase [Bacteroidia bacterium]|nr:branched-chain amino acid aminotransferase [Bacteroidia bacterium]
MAISIKISKTPQSRIHLCDFDNIEFGKIFSDHMFRVDYKNGAWQNPEILPYGPISIAPSLSAIHYGQAIFEGMKAFKSTDGTPLLFRPTDNAKRLNVSAVRMGMPEIPEELFMAGLTELIKLDQNWIPTKDGSALYIRPFMFATDDFVGVRPSENYSFIIFCCPVNSYYPKPIKVKVEEKYVRASTGMAGFAKAAGNYGISMLPSYEAKKEGYDQIIWTDGNNHEYVEESGTTNLFFVVDDNLVLTPHLDGNILNGITRNSCIQLLKAKGYAVEERKISINEIVEWSKSGRLTDCFGTGTAAIIAKIAAIGYKGNDYILPDAEQRVVSNYLYQTLYGIQCGKVEDPFHWSVKLD